MKISLPREYFYLLYDIILGYTNTRKNKVKNVIKLLLKLENVYLAL
jgi:hypothetical protein